MALSGRLLSLNVARASAIAIRDRKVMTAIGKRAVDGERALRKAQHVADEDVAFDDAGERQVLAESARHERLVPRRDAGLCAHRLPEREVLAGIRVHRLARPAVHAEVRLLVALDAEHRDGARAVDRTLADRRRHLAAADGDGGRVRDVEAEQPT